MAYLRLGQGNSFQRGNRTARALAALALALVGAACSGGGSSGSAASSQGFTYSGPTSWTITGPQGGPFANTSMNFMLQNTSSDALNWTASSVPAFVQLDLPSGSIAANSQATVHATLIAAMAQALPAGNSQGALTFHDDAGGQADVAIDCQLSVSAPGVTINLAPTADFASSGSAAGPFTPPTAIYTLTNTGSATLSWQATSADPWVTAAPAVGQLAHNASVDVTLTIADAATASSPAP